MTQVRVQVMLEVNQHTALKAHALAEGRSVSELIREAVDDLIREREQNQSAEEARVVMVARQMQERKAAYRAEKRGNE